MQVPKIISLLVCENFDLEKRNVTRIFDTINTPNLPATGPFVIFIRLNSGEGDFKVKVEFQGPKISLLTDDNKTVELTTLSSEIKMQKNKMHDVIMNLTGRIVFNEPGNYKVKAFVDGSNETTEHILVINKT